MEAGDPEVGGGPELARLDELLSRTPAVVVVDGPTGIGKTTLLRRFRRRHSAVHVAGLAWEQDLPGALAARLLDAPELPAHPAELGAHLLTRWRAAAEPLVVIVDDAHHADRMSLQAIASAVARLDAERLLLVLTRSTDEPAPDVLDRIPAVRLPVPPLTPDQARLLAARLTGVDLPMPVARRLCAHTGGIPRHLVDILRDTPPIRWSDWQTRLPVPLTAQRRVEATLAACSTQARALVEAAAVLGHEAVLADAVALGEIDDPITALDAAARAGLVTPAAGHGLDVLAFPVRFTRGAVYATLTPARRHALHRRAAELLTDETDRLRHRVEAAPLPDPGLADELVALAARKADEGAWAVVAGALIDASRISPTRADREGRLIEAVDALAGAGLLGQAVDALPDIEALPAGPRRDAVLAYVAVQRGRRAAAESYLDTAWRRRGADRDAAAVVCQRHVLHALAEWDGDALVTWAGRAVEHAAPGAPAAVEARAIVGLGYGARGDRSAALAAYRHAVTESPTGPQHQRSRMGRGWLHLAMDDPEAARRELEFAVPAFRQSGSNRITLWALAWLARARFALGDWGGALQAVDQAESLLGATGIELLRPLVHWTGAQVRALRGEVAAADRHLRLGGAGEHDYAVMTVPALLARAHVAETVADHHGVARHLAPLVRRSGLDEPGFWPWHDLYAHALIRTGRLDEADTFLGPHEKLAEQRGHRSARARLGCVRGLLHAARGDVDAAAAAFVQARGLLATLPLPYELARVDLAHGLTLRRAGRRRAAAELLTSARQAFAALGAQVDVERCDRELRTGRRGSAELTEQERSVAELVAAGMSNKEAAAAMSLSVKTIQFHLTRIYAKLGVRSRAELAARQSERRSSTPTMAP